MKRMLILALSKVCYVSVYHFCERIQQNVQKEGWQTDMLVLEKEENANRYYPANGEMPGCTYDVILEINTASHCIRESGISYETLGKEVWHLLLDHPMYHHEALVTMDQKFHIVCIDRKHAEYVRTYYPKIGSVHFLPLAADASKEWIPYDKRKYPVLFTGSYMNSATFLHNAKQCAGIDQPFFEQMVQKLLDRPMLTQSRAVWECIRDRKADLTKQEQKEIENNLPSMLHTQYFFDMYIRCILREEMLIQLLKFGIDVDVYGHNWELFIEYAKLVVPDGGKIHYHGEVFYDRLPEIYADSQIVLNILPWFKDGMHDRIPMGMNNGCVTVSDSCDYLEENLQDGENILFYSIEQLEELPALIKEIQSDQKEAAKIAAKAYAYGNSHFTWKKYTKELLHMIEK